MNGFLGTYTVNMDDKGRLNVPSKFKAILERFYDPQMVICVMDNFLIAFPQKEWQVNEEKLNSLSGLDREDRQKMREFYSRASECEMKSGKMLIPQLQREAAGLNKEVVLVGMSKTFEIWAGDRWSQS
ncbi:MAG: division/cell wall cluster transcriptional repressor MraZ [Nitrospinae bacterium]|nr:division/cell wall cluster transcriptional repressor MraZ [Nitrospinota bacterium]MCH8933756.1 division/cell wall cluster transcriptional repressor MraZ [Nitrospinota bacterium]TDJ51388.1 MAG: division/cell wall cluster transcriptional repressor MraZ [Nitrospina sp.]TDJ59447.1 MAG: division/cell wall cluster transcriptional repressor MraZ [Nitrospina sp.]